MFLIIYILIFILYNKLVNRNLLEGQLIELLWTVIPIFFLIFIAIPSLKILYLSDEINSPLFRLKIIGHQWYWEYEYNFLKKRINSDINFLFDSIILNRFINDEFRLLDVSENLIVPLGCQLRLLILSDDVIHSFTVPALGIKVDAVPGRLNQVGLNVNRAGIYYGQCSEICGINHRFIPIVLETVRLRWIIENIKSDRVNRDLL